MANSAKIKVQIQLDEAEAAKVLAGANQIAQGLGKIGTQQANEATQAQNNLSKSIANSIEQYEYEDDKLNQLLRTARALGKDEQFYAILHKKGYTEGIVAIQQMLGMKARDVGMTKEQIKQAQHHATVLRHESIAIRRAGADIHLFAQAAAITGAGIIGSVLLISKQYADSMKEANTNISAAYKAETHRLEIARNAIGEVFAQEAIPFIRQATDVISKGATFVRAHPEVVSAAIKVGEVLIAVGIVGKSLAIATRLTADFLAIQSSILRLIAARSEEALVADVQLSAAELQNIAADKQLAASQGQAYAGVEQAAGGGATQTGVLATISRALSSPGGVLALLAINIAAAVKLSQTLDKLQEVGNTERPGLGDKSRLLLSQIAQSLPGGAVVRLVESVRGIFNIAKQIEKHAGKQANARTATSPAFRTDITNVQPGSVAESEKLDEMLAAYEKYMADDLELVHNHYDKRQKIIQDEFEAIEKENKRNAKTMADITEDLTKRLGKLSRDLSEQQEDDERKYLERRADILTDADEDILKIEEELQEKLRKMRLEHEDKMVDLLAQRDAVGLVKEKRRFDREQSEAIRDANLEIAQRRKEIASKLAEIDREYAEQRARRIADYQERVQEAQEQATERREEEAERHQEAIQQIREQAAEKLAEEAKNYQTERKRLYDQFVQRLRDLDAFYLGERRLTQQRHGEMITQLDAFLLTYRNKLQAFYNNATATAPSGTTTGTLGHRATGGYAKYGMYWLGDRPNPGQEEFVMNGATTRVAEKLVGGRLNQQNLINGLSGGSTIQITLNDHRRFDSSLSVRDRMMIAEDTKIMLESVIARKR